MKIKAKLYTIISLILGVITVLIVCCCTIFMNSTLRVIRQNLQGDARIFRYMLNREYPGEYEVKEGQLYKGKVKINKANALYVIKNNTDYDCSLFLGDTRVATTINDKEGLLGAKAEQFVVDCVMKRGQCYIGRQSVGEVPYYTYYAPIKDKEDQIIGMLFVGKNITSELEQVKNYILIIIVTAVIVLIIALALMTIMAHQISDRILIATTCLEQVAKKDFTHEIPSSSLESADEMGDILRSIQKMKKDIIGVIINICSLGENVKNESVRLLDSAAEMSKNGYSVEGAIAQISDQTKGQAKALRGIEAANSVLEKSVMSMQQSVESINRRAEEVQNAAKESDEGIKNVLKGIQQYKGSFMDYSFQLRSWIAEIKKIGGIVDTISSISRKTNLLSINANIEAVRGGERGKGFSVVAQEIRRLAEQSEKATKQIEKIILGIACRADELLASTDEVEKHLDSQMSCLKSKVICFEKMFQALEDMIPEIKTVVEASDILGEQKDEIIAQVKGNAKGAQEIAVACEEMHSAMKQINEHIEEVEHTSCRLNTTVEQLAVELNAFHY